MIDKQIDLLIRAQLEKGKDLNSIVKTLDEISKALDRQAEAAKRGESSIDDLKATLLQLQDAQEQLRQTGRLVDSFTKVNDAIAKAEQRVERANKTYEKYVASLKEVENVSDAQQAKQNRLAESITKASTALARQRDAYTSIQDALQKAGIDTGNLASEQQRILKTATDIGKALETTRGRIASYTSDIRAAKEAERALNDERAKQASDQAAFSRAEEFYRKAAEARRRDAESVQQIIASRNAQIAADRRYAAEQEAQAKRALELAALREDITRRSIEAERALSAQRAQDAGDQAAFARTEEFYRKAAEARKRDAETVQQIVAARNAQIVADRRYAAEQEAQAKREQELAALREDIIKRSRDAQLTQTADDAEKTAAGYNSLARAAKSLEPKVSGVKEAIQSILDPSREARKTLDGLKTEVSDLAQTISKINGPVENYRDMMGRLVAAQKELAQQSGLIDNFNRQVVALRAARVEYVQARSQVQQYAEAVRQGGEAGATYTRSLAEAQTRAKAAAQTLAEQVRVTRESRDAVRQAGIATNDLAGAQAKLTGTARESVAAAEQLKVAYGQFGESVNTATKAKVGFRDEGRTTLSYMQRLRGQVLSLVAAYGGLFGAIGLAKGAIQSMSEQQAIESRIAVASDSNDPKVIGKEYEYVAGRAEYYGFALKDLANSYGNYAIAAKSADLNTEQTRYTFERLTAGMRVLKLNTDQSSRAWTQINQILSKTKPEMEDIKTIAESGFVGVQGMMARGLASIGVAGIKAGSEVNDMFELMKKGAIDSRVAIYALAVQADKELGGRVPDAIKSLQAEQGRFETAVFNFQKAIAESGWAEAYTKALQGITVFLKSEDGQNFAQTASDVFGGLATILVEVLKNFDLVKTVAEAFFALFLLNAAKAGITAVFEAIKTGAFGAAGAMGLLSKAFLALQIFIVAWEIGKYLYDKFEGFRNVIDGIVDFSKKSWVVIKESFQMAMDAFPAIAKNSLAHVLNSMTFMARKMIGVMGILAKAAGLENVETALADVVKSMTFEYADVGSAAEKAAKRVKDAWAQIDEERKKLAKPVDGKKTDGSTNTDTPTPRATTPTSRLKGEDDKELAKRERKVEEIRRALEALDAKIDRSKTESLRAQLDAIDTQYASLSRKIAELGGKEGSAFKAQLTSLTAALREQTIKKFNDDIAKEQEALQKKLEQLDAAAGRKNRIDLQSRLDAIEQTYAAFYREIDQLRDKFYSNGIETDVLDKIKVDAKAAVAELKRLEGIKFGQEQLQSYEQRFNELLRNRERLIAAVNAEKQSGLIDDVEAAGKINAINDRLYDQIRAAADAARDYALANQQIFKTPDDLAVFLSGIEALVAKIRASKIEFTLLEKSVQQGAVNMINNGLNAMADALQKVFAGQVSVRQGFRQMGTAFLQFAAQFLRDIALMIIKLAIFKALQNSGNPMLMAIGTAGQQSMGVKHDGGVIGVPGGRTRRVSTALWAGAPQYHSGGLMGLRNDEYATILQRGEEVLTADSPRNIVNGGAAAARPAGGGESPQGMRIVLVDDRTRVAEAMASPEGERVIVEAIRRNTTTVRNLMKG